MLLSIRAKDENIAYYRRVMRVPENNKEKKNRCSERPAAENYTI